MEDTAWYESTSRQEEACKIGHSLVCICIDGSKNNVSNERDNQRGRQVEGALPKMIRRLGNDPENNGPDTVRSHRIQIRFHRGVALQGHHLREEIANGALGNTKAKAADGPDEDPPIQQGSQSLYDGKVVCCSDRPILQETHLCHLGFGFVEPVTLGATEGEPPGCKCGDDDGRTAFDQEKVFPAW